MILIIVFFNSKIDINYRCKETDYILDMSQKGLRLIYGFIVTILNENNYPCFQLNTYKDGIYVGFYKVILEEVNTIQDDKMPSIVNIEFHISYSRDILNNTKFLIINDSIKFNYRLDKYNNNYVIPRSRKMETCYMTARIRI